MTIAMPDPIDTQIAASIGFARPGPSSTHDEERTEGRLRTVRPGSVDFATGGPNRSPGRVVQGFPIQQAKVQRPPLRAATLHRDRLLDWLDEHINRRVVLVTAEAGYGKTTLLADWARRARVRVLWFRIDEDDANWVSFVHYIVAAAREINPEFGSLTELLLSEFRSGADNRHAIFGALVSELAELAAAGRVALVLDDYHVVDAVPEIRELVDRLAGRAIDGLALVVLARRAVHISVARLRTLGEIAELLTDDLRFSLQETDLLFDESFRHPLKHDVLVDLARRTEGWAASLQLVGTTLRGRSEGEVRSFVQRLSGANGELHDYVAEELVRDLDTALRSFLMRTSLLQVVELDLAVTACQSSPEIARRMLSSAEAVGLLSRAGGGDTPTYRYHPLVREFLESRLLGEEGADAVSSLHRRLALAYESSNWRAAAHHYAAIGATSDIQRLLLRTAPQIMARGEFDAAKSYLDTAGLSTSVPAFGLFQSRVDLDGGNYEAALSRASAALETLQREGSDVRFAALANLASINLAAGNLERAHELAAGLADSDAPRELRDIGRGIAVMLEATADGRLDKYQAFLQSMEIEQRAAANTHYLAITLLNSGFLAQTRGDAPLALAKSTEAMGLLIGGPRQRELASARMNHAWATAHLGGWADARSELGVAIAAVQADARTDALVESADIWIWYGDEPGARRLVALAEAARDQSPLSVLHLPLTRIDLLCRLGRLPEAHDAITRLEKRRYALSVGYEARRRFALALVAVLTTSDVASQLVSEAMQFSTTQRSEFYSNALEVLQAVLMPTAAMDQAIRIALRLDSAYFAMAAEALIPRFQDMDVETFEALSAHIDRFATRWRDPLRRFLRAKGGPMGRPALLLERIGSAEDVALLGQLAKGAGRRPGVSRIGHALARRLAPRVFVEDQGRVRVRLAGRDVVEFDARRKVLALICFLITRPDLSATRDEVIDALWQEAEPSSAANSLNQTLYFLRRTLEPTYSEDVSPGYVHHQSDVVWLDGELLSSRSIRCRRLIDEIGHNPSLENLLSMSREYKGKFALDFLYEEWSSPYRETLHAAYLHAIEVGVGHLLSSGRFAAAIALTRHAVEVDPSAEQLEVLLVRAYHAGGAPAAVSEQYAHYVAYLRDSLGLDAPSLDELIDGAADS